MEKMNWSDRIKKTGRIKPKKSPWTEEEILLVAKHYSTRGELYNKNQKVYMAAYCKGLLDKACAHMPPSKKKNKFVKGVLDVIKVVSPVFQCETLMQFRENFQSEYTAGLRYGINYIEIFENKDDPQYMQALIVDLGQNNLARFVGAK